MSKIISLNAVREVKTAETQGWEYQAKIMAMDKVDLLEEMVRFQEERSQTGFLSPSLMVRGKYLFKALSETAETEALRTLTRTYLRHLECELRAYRENGIRYADEN